MTNVMLHYLVENCASDGKKLELHFCVQAELVQLGFFWEDIKYEN